jgi:hypothetical protein
MESKSRYKAIGAVSLVSALAAVMMFLLSMIGEHDFEMRPLSRYKDVWASPTIVGGVRSISSVWPATFVFRGNGGARCTGTAVGLRVILTAAHCVNSGGQGIVEIGGAKVSVACERHPDYSNVSHGDPNWEKKVSPDFALCELASLSNSVEAINTDGAKLIKSLPLRLLGFGCTQSGGHDFGVLYEGDSVVVRLPVTASYFTITQGGVSVCPGDSGGGAYLHDHARNIRLLVGINAQVNSNAESLISTTSEPGFLKWAKRWASTHKLKICGIHKPC